MTIGERIKEVRKSSGLTLEKFGAAILIKAQSVSKLEKGENNPSDQTVSLICREFHVNEGWLRTGEGEMFSKTYESELEAMCAERGLSHADYVAIRKIMEMPKAARDAVTAFMIEFAADIAVEQEAAARSREEEADEVTEKVRKQILNGGEKASESGTPPEGGVGIA